MMSMNHITDMDTGTRKIAKLGSEMKSIDHNCAGLVFAFKAHQRLHTRSMWPLVQRRRRAQEQAILINL
jgi:hypothetical protein